MSWQESTIGQLGSVVTGKTPPTKNRAMYDGDYMFVTPTDLDWQSYYVRVTHSTVTELARENHKNQFIPANSTVFTCIGNTIGKCGLTSEDCLSNQQINTVVPNDDHDPKFVYYLLNNNRPKIRSIGLSGGAAQPIINKSTFSAVKVSTPKTKIEEEKISSLLSAYDDLIENNRRRIVLLEEAARLLYREWFVNFRFPGHEHIEIIDGVPEGWSQGKVSDLGTAITGKTPSKKIEANFGDEIPFIKTPDMHGNALIVRTEEALSEQGANTQKNKTLPTGSVLVSCIGTVGAVSMNSCPAQTNQQINSVVPKNSDWQFFVYFALKSIKPLLEAMGGGATMANVNKTKFESVPILMPSVALIESYYESVKAQFELIEKLSRQNLKLAKARDLLLPRLMDGRLEI